MPQTPLQPESPLQQQTPLRPHIAVLLPEEIRQQVFDPTTWAELAETGHLLHATSSEQLLADPRSSTATILITGWGTRRLRPELLAQLPRLTHVLHSAGSLRPIITDAVWEAGITVASAAQVNNESVVDYLVAMLTLIGQGSLHAHRGMVPVQLGRTGLDLGLVSYGSIARTFAARAHAQGVQVSAWDPYADLPDWVQPRTLAQIFASADVVSVHTPLIEGQTEGLITGELLATFKPGAIFMNTARGAVVAEPELIQVLQNRPDVLAILDVTSPEPPPPDSPLRALPNVVLTGHSAGILGTDRAKLGRFVLAQVHTIAGGGRPSGQITREQMRYLA